MIEQKSRTDYVCQTQREVEFVKRQCEKNGWSYRTRLLTVTVETGDKNLDLSEAELDA